MGNSRSAAVIALVHVIALAGVAGAEIRYVEVGGSDWSDCTLVPCGGIRHAIVQANAGDTIIIGPGVFVESSSIVIQKALTIQGSGPGSTVVKPSISAHTFVVGSLPGSDGGKSNYHVTIKGLEIREGRVGVQNDATLTLEDVAIRDNGHLGIVNNNAGWLSMRRVVVERNRGGLLNQSEAVVIAIESAFLRNTSDVGGGDAGGLVNVGVLIMHASLVAGNTGFDTGGIVSRGPLVLTNVTISGNTATTFGTPGGVRVLEASAMLTHVTITGNSGTHAGALASQGGKVTLRNSILAGNSSPQCIQGSGGGIEGGGNLVGDLSCNLWPASTFPPTDASNMLGVDPVLAVLADNGGATWTHALLPGSFAIDGGYPKYCLSEDQRGAPRPFDGDLDGVARCDVGAFEYYGDTGGVPRGGGTRHRYWQYPGQWLRQGPPARQPVIRREPDRSGPSR
jgi:hypothetical protein